MPDKVAKVILAGTHFWFVSPQNFNYCSLLNNDQTKSAMVSTILIPVNAIKRRLDVSRT